MAMTNPDPLPPEWEQPPPEDFLPSPKRPLTAFQRAPKLGAWQGGLFASLIMIIVSMLHWGREAGPTYAVSFPDLARSENWWRFVSALFVHGDFDHLSHNLPPFLFFAWLLRGYFGFLAFPILSLVVGIAANIVTVWFYGDSTLLIGASGMIYGMVALWLSLYMAFETDHSVSMRIVRAVGFALALFFPRTWEPRVSYSAHLSGFLIGLFLGLVLIPLFRRTAPVVKLQRVLTPPDRERIRDESR